LLLLVLVGTGGMALSAMLTAQARTTATTTATAPLPGPTGEGPLGLPPAPDAEMDEARVKNFFAKIAGRVKNPAWTAEEVFDWSDLLTIAPEDAVETPPPHDGTPRDPLWCVRQVLQQAHADWKTWDWTKARVRKVTRRPDGEAIEAVVWHPTNAGRMVKRRWTLTDTGDDVQILGWEDLRTGLTSRDLAAALAAGSLSPSVRRQRQAWLPDVTVAHRLMDTKRFAEARRVLDRLRTIAFDGDLRYAVDLAEGRLAYADRRSNVGEWDQDLAVEVLEELVEKHPERLAAYWWLIEVHLLGEEWDRVIEVCDALQSVTGDDPDMLAARGEARAALLQAELAEADFAAVLDLDPHHPRALRWRWKQADEIGKKALIDRLATAPDPAGLFEQLVDLANSDDNGAMVKSLAERYRQLRPKDGRWVGPLAEALVRQEKVVDATQVLNEGLPVVPADDRADVVRRFVRVAIDTDQVNNLRLGSEVVPLPLRAVVLVKQGQGAVAEKMLRDEIAARRWFLPLAFADEDLGPLLRTDLAFAAFRNDFPPPADKPAPAR
jgi:tetratricopeptide (TPR) repeat protein